MKALTICQPYAELIMRVPKGAADALKRVENRTWPTRHRGALAIHAGKSRAWLDLHRPYAGSGHPQMDSVQEDRRYDIDLDDMDFGALIGVVDVIDCVPIGDIECGALDEKYSWIRAHEHAEGPWCWVLENARRLPDPIPYRGTLGLFDVPDELMRAVLKLRAA